VPYERLVVKLENGQIWRQVKGDTQRLRVDLGRNQTVNIDESKFGGYKLRLNEMRRTIRFERVQYEGLQARTRLRRPSTKKAATRRLPPILSIDSDQKFFCRFRNARRPNRS